MSDTSPAPAFVHLRLHTEFSISDGLVTIKPLIASLRKLDMPAVAVTDQANMFALIKFYSGALKAGIKPVCGCDVLVSESGQSEPTRLVLLAMDQTGYRNLTQLISELYTENSGYRGDALLGIDASHPYEVTWDTRAEADGPYVLVAKAFGQDLVEASSRASVTVDNTLPEVALIAPRDGSPVTGIVDLKAEASDVMGIEQVKFLLDGIEIGAATSPPYTVHWDSNSVSNTDHMLQARAVDLAGNGIPSRPVTIRLVNLNDPPVLSPIGLQTIEEGQRLSFTVEAIDRDGTDDGWLDHQHRGGCGSRARFCSDEQHGIGGHAGGHHEPHRTGSERRTGGTGGRDLREGLS